MKTYLTAMAYAVASDIMRAADSVPERKDGPYRAIIASFEGEERGNSAAPG